MHHPLLQPRTLLPHHHPLRPPHYSPLKAYQYPPPPYSPPVKPRRSWILFFIVLLCVAGLSRPFWTCWEGIVLSATPQHHFLRGDTPALSLGFGQSDGWLVFHPTDPLRTIWISLPPPLPRSLSPTSIPPAHGHSTPLTLLRSLTDVGTINPEDLRLLTGKRVLILGDESHEGLLDYLSRIIPSSYTTTIPLDPSTPNTPDEKLHSLIIPLTSNSGLTVTLLPLPPSLPLRRARPPFNHHTPAQSSSETLQQWVERVTALLVPGLPVESPVAVPGEGKASGGSRGRVSWSAFWDGGMPEGPNPGEALKAAEGEDEGGGWLGRQRVDKLENGEDPKENEVGENDPAVVLAGAVGAETGQVGEDVRDEHYQWGLEKRAVTISPEDPDPPGSAQAPLHPVPEAELRTSGPSDLQGPYDLLVLSSHLLPLPHDFVHPYAPIPPAWLLSYEQTLLTTLTDLHSAFPSTHLVLQTPTPAAHLNSLQARQLRLAQGRVVHTLVGEGVAVGLLDFGGAMQGVEGWAKGEGEREGRLGRWGEAVLAEMVLQEVGRG